MAMVTFPSASGTSIGYNCYEDACLEWLCSYFAPDALFEGHFHHRYRMHKLLFLRIMGGVKD